jgi:uncharacterized protein (UPF0332 family)
MKDLFALRSTQNVQAAQLLCDAGLYDASANRSYYAVFDAAFVACLHYGVQVQPDHAKVLSAFCGELVARRKIFSSNYKAMLYDLQRLRNQSDYEGSAISQKKAQQAVKTATTITTIILQEVKQ